MNHPRTAILVLALSLTAPALAQIEEPPICEGPGATAACHQALQSLDLLAAAKDAPTDPLELGAYLLAHDQAPEARELLLDELPRTNGEARDELLFLLGRAEAGTGRHAEAANAFGNILKPTFASRYNHALSRARAGDPTGHDDLEALLEDVLTAHTGSSELPSEPFASSASPLAQAVRLLLNANATLRASTGDYETAVLDTMRILNVLPHTPELLTAFVAYSIEATTPSVSDPNVALARAYRFAPNQSRALLLARAYDRAGQIDYASQHYQTAERLATETPDAHALAEIAAFHARNENWLASENATTRALAIDPTHATALYLSGMHHERAGRPGDAHATYQRAFSSGSHAVRTLVRLAATAHQTQQHQAAIEAAETALLESGAHPFAGLEAAEAGSIEALADAEVLEMLLILTSSHQVLGETPEALAYTNAIAQHPGASPDILTYLGDLHYQQGQYETALTHYRAAHTLTSTLTNDLAQRLYHAFLALEQYGSARDVLTPLVQAQPETAGETLHLIAWTYALDGESELALKTWERAVTAGSDTAQDVLASIE